MKSDTLLEILMAEAGRRSAAGVSLIEGINGKPCTAWVPAVSDEPRFLIYSITKVFTAVLILRLCEDRKLSLQDPVAKWFPRVTRGESIVVKQLLNHTAGLPDYGGLPAYHRAVRESPSSPWSFERFAAETFGKGLLFLPGEGWSYSNPGFMLARAIAEETSGASYPTLIADYIANPLELRDTFVAESITDLASLAEGTSCQLSLDGLPRDVRSTYHPGWVSHGVIASTASDVARFFAALFGGALLSERSLATMLDLVALPGTRDDTSHQTPLRPVTPSYGLGIMGDPDSPWGPIVGHNGGGPCYSGTAFHAFANGGLSVCCLTSIEDGFSTERVVAEILDDFARSR